MVDHKARARRQSLLEAEDSSSEDQGPNEARPAKTCRLSEERDEAIDADDESDYEGFINNEPQLQGSPPPSFEVAVGHPSKKRRLSKDLINEVKKLVQCGTMSIGTWFDRVKDGKVSDVVEVSRSDSDEGTFAKIKCTACGQLQECRAEIQVTESCGPFPCGRWCGRRIKTAGKIGQYLSVGRTVRKREVVRHFGLAATVWIETDTTPASAPADMLDIEGLYPSSGSDSSCSDDDFVLDEATHKELWQRY